MPKKTSLFDDDDSPLVAYSKLSKGKRTYRHEFVDLSKCNRKQFREIIKDINEFYEDKYSKLMTPTVSRLRREQQALRDQVKAITARHFALDEKEKRLKERENREIENKKIFLHKRETEIEHREKTLKDINIRVCEKIVFELNEKYITDTISGINITFLCCMPDHLDRIKELIQRELLNRV
jgi:hypothetical protein